MRPGGGADAASTHVRVVHQWCVHAPGGRRETSDDGQTCVSGRQLLDRTRGGDDGCLRGPDHASVERVSVGAGEGHLDVDRLARGRNPHDGLWLAVRHTQRPQQSLCVSEDQSQSSRRRRQPEQPPAIKRQTRRYGPQQIHAASSVDVRISQDCRAQYRL